MRHMLRRVVPPVLVLGMSAAALWAMVKWRRTATPNPVETPLPTLELRALERVNFPISVRSQGTVEAATTIRLIPEVDGMVTAISPSLKRGGVFRKGELLVAIDSRDFELAATRASAQVASAQLRLATAEAEAKVAAQDWQEMGTEQEASALLLWQPQLAEAKSTLAAAQADLEKANLDLERTQITAPFDGRVRRAAVDAGQFVRRGEELASLFGVDRVEVRLPLPLAEWRFLDIPPGESSEDLRRRSIPVALKGRFGRREHHWHGQVVRVDGEVDVNSRMVAVIAEVKNPYGAEDGTNPPLKVGMFVEAEIQGRTAKGVYVVPRSLVLENRQALAVDAEGRLRIRELQILRADRERAVIEGGFELGDRLCLSAVDVPVDGMKVNVVGKTARGGE